MENFSKLLNIQWKDIFRIYEQKESNSYYKLNIVDDDNTAAKQE